MYNAIPHAALLVSTPLLVVHGTNDLFLLPEYAQAAYDAATEPKDLIRVETRLRARWRDLFTRRLRDGRARAGTGAEDDRARQAAARHA
jgi:hypothetical protein